MKKPVERWRLGALAIGAIVIIIIILGGYLLDWKWTGLPDYRQPDDDNYERGKTFWDWLDLLVVPSVLAIGALWFNQRMGHRQNASQQDRYREEALQQYFDKMTNLLVDKGLREQDEYTPVSDVARTHTVTILRKLDRKRIMEVLDFLRDADLYSGEKAVLMGARMSGIDLSKVNLWRANLTRTDLTNANFCNSDLYGIDLRQANLCGANLRSTNLSHARLKDASIDPATCFDGTTILPNGHRWSPSVDLKQFGLIVKSSSEPTMEYDD